VNGTHLNAPSTSSPPQLQEKSQTGTAVGSSEETKSEVNGGDQRGRKTEENA
jgi:hypothetical protein